GITILTTISLSAIATNLNVKGGGDYYLISRTLGLEFGGAIGIVLFLAQSVSIAFYCIGFGEVIAGLIPKGSYGAMPQIIAASAVAFLFIFAWLGADWATRFQYVVMFILLAALVSFFTGGLMQWDNSNLTQNWSAPEGGLGFWVLFAIFFPAVTGFTQGVSMSGDLKDPGKSLPTGTFLAIGVSIFVYFFGTLLFASSLSRDVLVSDYSAMNRVAAVDFLITAGVVAATLSSAMASFLGAPRILQSLAGDRIFPFLLPFAKGSGTNDNPRRGVLLSAVIALVTISLGNLNVIAPIVSMFFLISYGLLNYATYFESRSDSPSFRPRFRLYDYRISLVGCLACFGVILAIDLSAGIIAIAVLIAIYQYLLRTSGPARWADSRRSHHIQQIHEHLIAASKEPEHPRNWRPHLLVFTGDSNRREKILKFASWFKGRSGFVTAVQILEGWGAKMIRLRAEMEETLQSDIAKAGSDAFPLLVTTPTLSLGLHTILQSYGIGPLKANTILLNWIKSSDDGSRSQYGRHLRTAYRLGCNLLVLDAKQHLWEKLENIPSKNRRIDVWWWGDASSRLMLLLAYLMTRSDDWKDSKIRVLAAGHDPESQKTVDDLKQTLDEIRIDAEPEIIAKPNADAISAYSSDAEFVFLPFRLKNDQLLDPFDGPLESIITRLPIVTLVLAAEDIDLDAEPEEGTANEIAEALDALANARKSARKAEKDAEEAAGIAEQKMQELEKGKSSGTDEQKLSEKESEAMKAEQTAIKSSRRAVKAAAKAEIAEKDAESIGAVPPDET
ncbi:MAG: amino acid permease, partial [Deltaproteobacteria bacterium]|nr:amino acid permease [Deltaproteobacteria bacterium]